MKNHDRSPKWEKTREQNLVRYAPSGGYYARLRIGGKLVWRALKTQAFSVAKLRLHDLENEERARAETKQRLVERGATFGDALVTFENQLDMDVKLKPGAKLYRRKTIAALLKSWPALRGTRVAKLTEAECRAWAHRFHTDYSPSVYNNTLATLQMVIDLAVRSGVRYQNPAKGIPRARPTQRKLTLQIGRAHV